uniref:molybdopterin molybdotransferase n=1 Tax=Angiostrongylus cantonensis TaxID=6313 RepID=A0A0K0D015_ANGCA
VRFLTHATHSSFAVSDSCAAGTREDLGGPAVVQLIEKSAILHDHKVVSTVIVPDEMDLIEAALIERCKYSDVIITTGGTGFSKRDVTPEATINVVDRRCTGLEVALHAHSLAHTPMAALSRAVAGIRDKTVIVNMPGGVRAVQVF